MACSSRSHPQVIPAGHAFLNMDTFVTIKAKDMAKKLLDQAENRNPDMFDMYIHNGQLYIYIYQNTSKI